MFYRKIIILFAFACILTNGAEAQDPLFTQFNSVPLYYNPAFAGSITESRLALNYRDQWRGIYKTMYISYDQPVKALHGGLGLVVYNDVEGSIMNTFYSALVYAPKFKVKEKFTISPGIKIGYRRQTFNFSNLNFGDFNSPQGTQTKANPLQFIEIKNNIDISSGLVVNLRNFYFGFAIDHLNRPNTSPIQNFTYRLPIHWNYQFGYTFQRNETSKFSISPNVIYQQQLSSKLLDAKLFFKYQHLLLGGGYTSAKYATFLLGFQSKNIILIYSYDLYKSPISDIFGGANEVSLRYLFKFHEKKQEPVK